MNQFSCMFAGEILPSTIASSKNEKKIESISASQLIKMHKRQIRGGVPSQLGISSSKPAVRSVFRRTFRSRNSCMFYWVLSDLNLFFLFCQFLKILVITHCQMYNFKATALAYNTN